MSDANPALLWGKYEVQQSYLYWLFHITNSGPIYETLAFNSVDLVYPECKLGFADSFTRKVGLHKAHI